MELSETKKLLIEGLRTVLEDKEVMLAIALMLKTEPQMLTMLDYIVKHNQENPPESEVIQVAQLITERVS